MSSPATLFDVFLSYRRADVADVRRFVAALEHVGLQVWVDETEVADFESITRRIQDGLSRSKVLVAWYSTRYPESRACQWELTAAYLAAQRTGRDPRERVLVVNPEPANTHIHPLELRDAKYVAAVQSLTDAELQTLACVVRPHVAAINEGLGKGQVLTPPRWYGLAQIGSNRFVGRLPDLWRVHSSLWKSTYAIVTGAFAGVTTQLTGLGGVGKSLLAEEYARRYGAAYPGGVFSVRAFGNDTVRRTMSADERIGALHDQLRSFAVAVGTPTAGLTPDEIAAALARRLDEAQQPFLWMVDDVPNGLQLDELAQWHAPGRYGKTLVTTRSREYDGMGDVIVVDTLPWDDALALLTRQGQTTSDSERDAATRVAAALGHHPQALDIAAAVVSGYFGSYEAFEQALQDPTTDALELAAELVGLLPNGHEKSIVQTMLASVRRLGPEGVEFLLLASLLAVAPISVELLAAVFAQADGLNQQQSARRARVAFSQVDKLSLVEDGGTRPPKRLVHGLVSRVMRRHSESQQDRLQELRSAAVSALIAVLPAASDIRQHQGVGHEVAHARELAGDPEDLLTGVLLNWVARYDLTRGLARQAAVAYRKLGSLLRRLLGPEHPDTLISMNDLACALRAQGDLAGARDLQTEVLSRQKRLLGPEHPDTLTSTSNLAGTLYDQGDVAGARALEGDVLVSRKRLQGSDHPDTLASMHHLALTLHAQGDLAGARTLEQEVVTARKRRLGQEHPDTLMSMNSLAVTLCAQGDFAGARAMQQEVLTVRKGLLGPEHPDTLTSMNSLALTVAAQGDVVSARTLQEEALPLSKRVLGPDHAWTLTTMNNLAVTLRAQGDLPAALGLLREVVSSRERSLGPEHPSTLRSMNNLADLLSAQGSLADARALQQQVLSSMTRVLGSEHPDTLTAMNNLAFTRNAQGDLAGARAMQDEVVSLTTRLLGPEHPETLRSMSNLAETLRGQGDLAGARALHEHALSVRKRLLGREHPDTSISGWNLFLTLSELKHAESVAALLDSDLRWLLEADAAALHPQQRHIRQLLGEKLGHSS